MAVEQVGFPWSTREIDKPPNLLSEIGVFVFERDPKADTVVEARQISQYDTFRRVIEVQVVCRSCEDYVLIQDDVSIPETRLPAWLVSTVGILFIPEARVRQ